MAKKKINSKVKKLVAKYLDLVEQKGIKIEQAYIFGSQVKGNTHSGSDIDVCVVSNKLPKNSYSALTKLGRISLESDEFIDIEAHGFTTEQFADPFSPLAHEIKKTGVRLL